MIRVALTGGIATGKSFCLARFAELGAEVIDADLLAREAVAPGSPGLLEVTRQFGLDVLHADGTLDRAALAQVVFQDPSARAALEAIVHPRVYGRITSWFAGLPSAAAVAIADIPLLFETGRERDFQRVVVCACTREIQLARLVARDGLSVEESLARLAAQWPVEEKARLADHVIRTDGTFEVTARQVLEVFRQLRADS